MRERIYDRITRAVPSQLAGLINHPGFQRYGTNTGWVFFGQVCASALAFFTGALIARSLGPAHFGLLNYTLSFCALFSFLVGFGVDSILTRELVQAPDQERALLASAFWLKVLGGGLSVVVINFVAWILNYEVAIRTLLFIFSLTNLLQGFTVISGYFQARVLSRYVTYVQMSVIILSAFIKCVFVYWHLGVAWFIGVYVWDALVLAGGLIYAYTWQTHRPFSFSWNAPLIIRLGKAGLPLMLTTIAVFTYSKIDQVLIRQLVDDRAVGLYSVAVRLTEVWYLFPTILCSSLFPAIVGARMTNRTLFEERLKSLYFVVFWFACAIIAGGVLLGAPVINVLFGSAYAGSVPVFYWYICSIIPSCIMVVVNYYLVAEGYTAIYAAITCVGAGLNILLNMVLIPNYGIAGAAWATVISYCAIPLSLVAFKKTRSHAVLMGKALVSFPVKI